MDRAIVYPGAVPLETDLLNTNRNTLIALGLLTLDIFGTTTVVGGLPCAPTAPGSLDVQVGPGRIYSLEAVDSTAYSSLPADLVDDIVKQGINLATTTLSCPAPGTVGDSINYLIEAMYEDLDGEDAVLSYYNASNPGDPYSGPGGDNDAQPTMRQGLVGLQVKAGIPAPTGSQVTPAADAGWTALYIVTVANGQSAITAGNITVYPGAPFITGALLSEPVADGRYLKLIGGVLSGALTGTSGIFVSLTVDGVSVQNAAVLTSGLVATTQLGTGAANNGVFLRGDNTWAQPTFGNIAGSIGSAQVPLAAVSQWQLSLTINGSQVSGAVGEASTILNQGIGYATFHWSGQAGQPTYVWGSNDGVNFYPWLPQNFDVNEVQGYAPSAGAVANTLVLRDNNGFVYGAYFNQASAQSENPAVSQVMVTNGSDNFLRKAGIAYFAKQLFAQGLNLSASDPGYLEFPGAGPDGSTFIFQWGSTGNLGDIPANGTLEGSATFPITFPTRLLGIVSDSQDLGGNLASYLWDRMTSGSDTSGATWSAHEIINVIQAVSFSYFSWGY